MVTAHLSGILPPTATPLPFNLFLASPPNHGILRYIMNTLPVPAPRVCRSLHPVAHATRRLLAALGLCLALAGPAQASMTPDAKPKKFPPNPAKHQLTIRREAGDATQAKMIAAAEAARPSAQALRKAIGDGPAPEGESPWWYREALGIRIPFAVTADAVAYYSKLVEGYRKQTFERYMEPSSRFDYHAASAHHPKFEREGRTFKDVHVVTLKLGFSQNFAATGTEGMEFQKERTVILDSAGKVLAIFGDGPTEVPVLAI